MKYAAISITVLLSGCVATDVGNPQTEDDTTAEVHLEAFEEQQPAALTLDDQLTLTHAWVSVDRMQFEECEQVESDSEESGDSEEESESDGESEDLFKRRQDAIVVTDLITGTSFPGPIRLGQPGMEFCAMSFDIRPVAADEAPDGTPADMLGYSMLVRGTREDGTPFIVRGGFDEEVELEGDIRLGEAMPTPVVLGFAANSWLSQGELESLPGEVIEIDIDRNRELYEGFVEAVPRSARLFLDDGDGRLDANEATRPVALPKD